MKLKFILKNLMVGLVQKNKVLIACLNWSLRLNLKLF